MKSHYIGFWQDKVNTSDGVIKYCREALAHQGLEDWERKEYSALLKSAQRERRIAQNKVIAMSNNMVST